MSGGQWMVVLIVAMVVIGKLVSRNTGYPGWGGRRLEQGDGAPSPQIEKEMRELRERMAVLERIATDDRGVRDLDRQIEALRDQDSRQGSRR